MLASADLLVFTERPTPNSRTVGYAMNRITHNAAPKAKGVAHEQSKVRRSGCPRETHCRRVAEASGGKVLRFAARHRRNAPSRLLQRGTDGIVRDPRDEDGFPTLFGKIGPDCILPAMKGDGSVFLRAARSRALGHASFVFGFGRGYARRIA